MEITWIGHSCFRIKGREATVVTDPFEKGLGYSLGRLTANIVTVSHGHPHHSFVAGVEGSPKVVRGPGEYEIANILITGIRSSHDNEGGKRRGKNTIYLIEMDELKVCHLGDLGHLPTSEQSEELSNVDVLLVPVGGVSTINAAAAAETISLLEPKMVIPMHFKTEVASMKLEPLDRFLKEMGLKEITTRPKVAVSKAGLPKETEVVLLDYAH